MKIELRQFPSIVRDCPLEERVGRRPLEPAPILSLKTNEYLSNPYIFVRATLLDHQTLKETPLLNKANLCLSGNTLQSMNKLDDIDNIKRHFFIFNDLSIRKPGTYCLKFELYEMENLVLKKVDVILSPPFSVISFKKNKLMKFLSTTPLTSLLVKQGMKLKARRNNNKFKVVQEVSRSSPYSLPSTYSLSSDRPPCYHVNYQNHDVFDNMFQHFLQEKNILPISTLK